MKRADPSFASFACFAISATTAQAADRGACLAIRRTASVSKPFAVRLDPATVEELVELVAARVLERLTQTTSNGSPWLTVVEAAAYLHISEGRLRKLIQRRAVPFHQEAPRARILLRRDELNRELERCREGPAR